MDRNKHSRQKAVKKSWAQPTRSHHHFLWRLFPDTKFLGDYLHSHFGLCRSKLQKHGDPEDYIQLLSALVVPLPSQQDVTQPPHDPTTSAAIKPSSVRQKSREGGGGGGGGGESIWSTQTTSQGSVAWGDGGYSADHESHGMDDVLDRLTRASTSTANVLTLGYRCVRWEGEGGMVMNRGVHCDHVNSTRDELRTHKWAHTLLWRIGAQRVLELLTANMIFTPLKNNTYLQVAGPPLSSVLSKDKELVKRYQATIPLTASGREAKALGRCDDGGAADGGGEKCGGRSVGDVVGDKRKKRGHKGRGQRARKRTRRGKTATASPAMGALHDDHDSMVGGAATAGLEHNHECGDGHADRGDHDDADGHPSRFMSAAATHDAQRHGQAGDEGGGGGGGGGKCGVGGGGAAACDTHNEAVTTEPPAPSTTHTPTPSPRPHHDADILIPVRSIMYSNDHTRRPLKTLGRRPYTVHTGPHCSAPGRDVLDSGDVGGGVVDDDGRGGGGGRDQDGEPPHKMPHKHSKPSTADRALRLALHIFGAHTSHTPMCDTTDQQGRDTHTAAAASHTRARSSAASGESIDPLLKGVLDPLADLLRRLDRLEPARLLGRTCPVAKPPKSPHNRSTSHVPVSAAGTGGGAGRAGGGSGGGVTRSWLDLDAQGYITQDDDGDDDEDHDDDDSSEDGNIPLNGGLHTAASPAGGHDGGCAGSSVRVNFATGLLADDCARSGSGVVGGVGGDGGGGSSMEVGVDVGTCTETGGTEKDDLEDDDDAMTVVDSSHDMMDVDAGGGSGAECGERRSDAEAATSGDIEGEHEGGSDEQSRGCGSGGREAAPLSRPGNVRAPPQWAWSPSEFLRRLLDYATPHEQVHTFLRCLLRSILPLSLVGSTHNLRILTHELSSLIHGTRMDTLSTHRVASRVRTRDVGWLERCVGVRAKRWAVWRVVVFVVREVVVPVLRSAFYVTEADGTGHALWFFRASVWARAQAQALKELCDDSDAAARSAAQPTTHTHTETSGALSTADGQHLQQQQRQQRRQEKPQFVRLDRAAAEEALRTTRLGVSEIRLLPKKKGGIRVLTNLSKAPLSWMHKGVGGAVKPAPGQAGSCGGADPSAAALPPDRVGTDATGPDPPPPLYHHPLLSLSLPLSTQPPPPPPPQHSTQPAAPTHTRQPSAMAPPPPPQLLPVNRALANAYQVIKYEACRRPELAGFGILGLDAAVPRLQSFIQSIKSEAGEGPLPKLYFVGVDITRCYDNINIDRLLQIVKDEVLTEDGYSVRRYSVTYPFQSRHTIFTRHIKEAYPEGDWRPFPCVAGELASVFDGSVVTDGVLQGHMSRAQVLSLLEEHLRQNTVMLPCAQEGHDLQHVFKQVVGIPQGSLMSAMLCTLYLGSVERSGLFANVAPLPYADHHPEAVNARDNPMGSSRAAGPHALLLRLIDDYLLVTTDLRVACRFLERTHHQLPSASAGVRVNRDKTRANFAHVLVENDHTALSTGLRGEQLFPWCGLLISTYDCQVHKDYSRVLVQGVSELFSFDGARAALLARERMKGFLKSKAHVLTLDTHRINKRLTALYNIYEAFVFCAAKSLSMFSCLPHGAQHNPTFLLSCINDTLAFAHSLTQRRTRAHARRKRTRTHACLSRARSESVDAQTECRVDRTEVAYLGLSAFLQVLESCRPVGPALLSTECGQRLLSGLRDRLSSAETVGEDVARIPHRRSSARASLLALPSSGKRGLNPGGAPAKPTKRQRTNLP